MLFTINSAGQTFVLDSLTHEPISFASVYDKDSPSLGTSANIDGYINFHPSMNGHHIRITSIGYRTLDTIYNSDLKLIYLSRVSKELDEVIIKATDNPAIEILRKVLQYRKDNSLDDIPYYQCLTYLKTKASLSGTKDTVNVVFGKDTVAFPRVLMISESVVQKHYQRYNKSYENVLLSSVSGLKEPNFAFTTSDLQSMDPYESMIRLYGREYINPVSNLSWLKYRFNLSRKYTEGKDTLYVINFWPKSKASNAFKGFLIISSKKWGIQKVRLETYSEDLYPVILHLENSYQTGRWFPEKMISEVKFPFPIPIKNNADVLLNITATFSDVHYDSIYVNPFKANTIEVNSNKLIYDRTRLDSFRSEPLSKVEKNAYANADQLLGSPMISYLLNSVEYFLKLQIPISIINLNVDKILRLNNHEGVRYGLGFVTNRNLSRFWDIGAYANYGSRDKTWKYGIEVTLYFNKLQSDFFRASYSDDLSTNNLFDFRNTFYNKYFSKYYAREKTWKGLVNLTKNPFNLSFTFSSSSVQPLYSYIFKPLHQELKSYNNDEINIRFTYTKSKQYNFFNTYYLVRDIDFPVLQIDFNLGTDKLFMGMFNYKSLTIHLNQYLNQKFLGQTLLTLEAGKMWGHPPFFRLFNSPGSRTERLTLLVPNAFQTMPPNKYWSSKFLHFYFNHIFNRFYTLKFSRPSLYLTWNSGWGWLDHNDDHELITLDDYRAGYHEAGIGFMNLLRLSIKDIVGIGLNLGAYYPMLDGAQKFNKESLVYKIGISFSY